METAQSERRTLTIPEVAAALGLARSTAYELAATDRLPVPVIRLGRKLVVSRALVERVLAGDDVRSPMTSLTRSSPGGRTWD
jgi:excisionase family DNA binding protein